jgi:hypothetical protein
MHRVFNDTCIYVYGSLFEPARRLHLLIILILAILATKSSQLLFFVFLPGNQVRSRVLARRLLRWSACLIQVLKLQLREELDDFTPLEEILTLRECEV